jgi:hypothetical protein
MLAPVLNQNATYRAVYFPAGTNWYDFYTGRLYKGGDLVAVQNQMTDPVPMFLREGTGVLWQDVTNIRKTSQLGNEFILRAAFVFNSRNSTTDLKKYDSVLGLLSIKDYNNESNIQACIREGCEYTILAVLAVSKTSKNLELDIGYAGGQRLNEAQIIRRLEIYYEGGSVIQALTTPLTITGPGRVVIPLNSAVEVEVPSRRGYTVPQETDKIWVQT